MLVQQIAGTIRSLLVERALRFGSAKPCPVGVRLFRRLFSLAAFLKSFQVDHVTHARSHHAISWWHAALHEDATAGAGRRRIFRPCEIRLASGKYSRSLIPRVSRSQNHYSHLRNTRQPARSSFRKSPTLNSIKKSPVLQKRNNLCSSTGLRSCDSSAVLFFRRYDS